MEIRQLTNVHLADLVRLSSVAAWNQTPEDWLRILRIAGGSSFGIQENSSIVSSATLVRYGEKLSWIGMVLTAPEYRGRGYARMLLQRCLETAGDKPVKLDATADGRPMYLTEGFRDEVVIERWVLPEAPVMDAPDLPPVQTNTELDYQVFGAERMNVLRTFNTGALLEDGSYALSRPGRIAAYFGPCVSRSIENTRILLQWNLAQYHGRPVYWDLFPDNSEVVELASEFGFERSRKLMRMVKNADPRKPDSRYHAAAGFEFG